MHNSKESDLLQKIHSLLSEHFDDSADPVATSLASVKTSEGKEGGAEIDPMHELQDELSGDGKDESSDLPDERQAESDIKKRKGPMKQKSDN